MFKYVFSQLKESIVVTIVGQHGSEQLSDAGQEMVSSVDELSIFPSALATASQALTPPAPAFLYQSSSQILIIIPFI